VLRSANLIGTQLGNYEIQALLGAGGMASVYRGFDRNLRRQVAIKVLSDIAAQPDFADRFRQEARLIASLRHPNIVQVYDFGEHDGQIYMVQELLPGPTLQQRLRELMARGETLARDDVLAITAQLASALDAAHAAGIIHRDVKPANAIWNAGGALVLTDFGIAKNTLLSTGQTQTGLVIGTPDYLSPEQAQGKPLTPSSDIYSLGVVLYELLAGKTPFSSGTPLGVVMSHIQDPPPPLHPLRPDLPPAAEAVVQQALAKDPAARFRTATILARTLERLWPASAVSGRNVTATSIHEQATRVWEAAPAQPAPSARPPVTPRPAAPQAVLPPAPLPRRRPRAALIMLGVLIAALVLGRLVLGGRGAGQPAATGPVVAATAPAVEATAEPQQQTTAGAAPPTAAPQPTAAPPTPELQPTAAPPTAAPQPTAALEQLRALLEAGNTDGRAEKAGDALIGDLDKATQALADGNKKRAIDGLRALQRRLVEGIRAKTIDIGFARQALAGIDAVANAYDLKLPPIKDKGD
jgi:hypothetical protein